LFAAALTAAALSAMAFFAAVFFAVSGIATGSATEPPAASIAARAPLVTPMPRTLTLRDSSPDLITRASSASADTTPACFSTIRSISSIASLCRSDRRTTST